MICTEHPTERPAEWSDETLHSGMKQSAGEHHLGRYASDREHGWNVDAVVRPGRRVAVIRISAHAHAPEQQSFSRLGRVRIRDQRASDK